MTTRAPLPSRAKALRAQAEREKVHGIEWTDKFPPLAINQLLRAIYGSTNRFHTLEPIVTAYLVDESQSNGVPLSITSTLDSMWGTPRTDDVLDVLDAVGLMLDDLAAEIDLRHSGGTTGGDIPEHFAPWIFREAANEIFLEFRIAYKFINGRLQPREHEELHADVIQPLELILTSNPKFARAETAYREAMTALTSGQPGAAVTSAGSALQEALLALGATGNDLSSLMNNAVYKRFLSKHDDKLKAAFKNIAAWVNADRSTMGTAHGAAAGERDDAWLAIHVVGALIVRLASEEARGAEK